MGTAFLSVSSLEVKLRGPDSPFAAAGLEHLEVTDVSGNCGTSFSIVIVSSAFQGKMLLARHRLVNDFLKDEIARMHAFSQRDLTPAEWQKEKEKALAQDPQ